MVTLITGGVKSGKTAYAIKKALSYKTRGYIATAEPFDEEMKNKIKRHKAERENKFITFEEPIEIVTVLKHMKDCDVVVLDCLTTWLNNLLFYQKDMDKYVDNFLHALSHIGYDLIIISNEVGLGIVPVDKSTRRYINVLGILNQKVASVSDNCIFMVSGIPITIKERR